mgnify:FL=1
MKIKHYIVAFFTALLCSQNASAQQKFNEVSYSPSETTFRLIAPNKPTLRLDDAGTGGKAYKKIKMEQSGENTWTTAVKGNLTGKF